MVSLTSRGNTRVVDSRVGENFTYVYVHTLRVHLWDREDEEPAGGAGSKRGKRAKVSTRLEIANSIIHVRE